MLSINTNLSSLITQHSMKSATQLLNQAVERMTTGYKINHSKDNAANYSIATNLTTKINSYMVAEENCAMGLDLLATANGSLDLISDKLTRLRDLTTQASNGTYGTPSLEAINAEANALVDEINRLYSTAEYNGKKLFASDTGTPAVATFSMRSATTELYTYTKAEVAAMDNVKDAINSGNLTSGKEYSISTIQDLLAFADYVNAGNDTTGITFVLANNIDLSSISNWTPIISFKGTFDGNGNKIYNLKINDSTLSNAGFFASISGTVKNITLKNVDVIGNENVGGLVGSSTGTIINSSATGTVIGSKNVGGLVGYISKATIENCYSEGSVSGTQYVGGLVGYNYLGNTTIQNCYSTSNVIADTHAGGILGGALQNISLNNCFATGDVSGRNNIGGLVGYVFSFLTIVNSFATGNITGTDYRVGGLAGCAGGTPILDNSYATGNVTGVSEVGGLVGNDFSVGGGTMTNCASVQADSAATQMTKEQILATYTFESMGFTEANGWTMVNGEPALAWQFKTPPVSASGSLGSIYLQIGTSSDSNSQIGFEISFSLGNIDDLRMIGVDTTTDYLSRLDNMLATVNAKQTEFGAVENRLESALESISVNIENLTSSLSTIRDADIAEVSSEYIRQQILQQASATLMATVNQSPSIALQLI